MPAMRRIAAGTTVGVLVLASIGAGFALWRHAASDTPQVHRLADGTLAAFAADTRLIPGQGFPVRREVSVEGEALLRVPVVRRPLTLDTPLLRIDVIRASTLLVTARARQAGEEVRMLSGEAIVSKRYPSPYPAPARLRAGEMAMVNRTIDLMETEPIAAHTLARMREWAKTRRRSDDHPAGHGPRGRRKRLGRCRHARVPRPEDAGGPVSFIIEPPHSAAYPQGERTCDIGHSGLRG